jgi:hypothetical protein
MISYIVKHFMALAHLTFRFNIQFFLYIGSYSRLGSFNIQFIYIGLYSTSGSFDI